MKTALIILSSAITILASLPYIVDILRRKTKPRIVSWFTWTLLTGISAAASFSDHRYPAGILAASAFTETLFIVILGIKYGEKEFTVFDIICQLAAIAGLLLWWVFNSPSIAIIAAIAIDFIGCLPTLKHAWEKPAEETWLTFALSGLGAVCTVLAVSQYTITSIASPIYLVCMNTIFTLLLLWRKGRAALQI